MSKAVLACPSSVTVISLSRGICTMTTSVSSIRKWYVLRTFSGHEKKVKQYLEDEVERLGYEDKLAQIVIPTETVFEMRAGKKKTREKRSFPGYILLEAIIDGHLKELIAGAPSTIGFLGSGEEDRKSVV